MTISDRQHHIGWIDYAKAFAIYSVVLLHTHCVEALSVAINGYVMPLFFFLSGFLFSRDRNPEFIPFLKKRFRQLIIPYLWINLVAYVIWVTVLRHFGNDPGDTLQWQEPLWGILLGIPPALVHDIPIWSILCFFVVEIIFYVIPPFGKFTDLIIAACAWIVASVISLLAGEEGVALPLTIAPAAGALAFYALGHYISERTIHLKLLFSPSAAVLLLGLILLTAGLSLNIPTAFFLGILGNPLYFFIGAIGGVITGVQIAGWLDRIFHDGTLIRMISRGTLIICGFHLLAFAFIKGVMLFCFGIQPEALVANLPRGILFSMAATLLCLPLIWIIERWFRFLVSK